MNSIPSGSPPATATFTGSGLICVRGGRVIFTRLDFTLAPGEILVLLGPNGSGKSSLLRVMAGLLRPFAGTIQWQGEALAEDPERHAGRTHYVGHHDAIKPVLSVAENLRFWARLHQSGGDADQMVATALDAFGLTRLASVPGRMLSAGQKRRTNLARLLAAPAPLWLLDEPTTALDRKSVAIVEERIRRHCGEGGMAVLSTHSDMDLPGQRELWLDHFAPSPDVAEIFL
jgi:heme exporter protein A